MRYERKAFVADFVDAEQWFPGNTVNGVVFPDPNPTDNPMMGYAVAQASFVTERGRVDVMPGDWICTQVSGKTAGRQFLITAEEFDSTFGPSLRGFAAWESEPAEAKDFVRVALRKAMAETIQGCSPVLGDAHVLNMRNRTAAVMAAAEVLGIELLP